jgi:hypothetical protein
VKKAVCQVFCSTQRLRIGHVASTLIRHNHTILDLHAAITPKKISGVSGYSSFNKQTGEGTHKNLNICQEKYPRNKIIKIINNL